MPLSYLFRDLLARDTARRQERHKAGQCLLGKELAGHLGQVNLAIGDCPQFFVGQYG